MFLFCVSIQINELEMTHLQSLWNLLSLKRVILLTEHGQDPFDKLNAKYKVPISLENETTSMDTNESEISSDSDDDKNLSKLDQILMEKICRDKKFINLNNMFNFINLLYKLVVCKLIRASENESDDNDGLVNESNLKENLVGLMDELSIDVKSAKNEEVLELDVFNLSGLKLKHAYHLWKLAVNIYLTKKNI